MRACRYRLGFEDLMGLSAEDFEVNAFVQVLRERRTRKIRLRLNSTETESRRVGGANHVQRRLGLAFGSWQPRRADQENRMY